MSILNGEFPDLQKSGGSSQDINNYRPISLLTILGKIIEKLIHKRFYNFMQEHEILYPNQFGFRKTTQLSNFGDDK